MTFLRQALSSQFQGRTRKWENLLGCYERSGFLWQHCGIRKSCPSFSLGLAGFQHAAGSPSPQAQIGAARGRVRTETVEGKGLAHPRAHPIKPGPPAQVTLLPETPPSVQTTPRQSLAKGRLLLLRAPPQEHQDFTDSHREPQRPSLVLCCWKLGLGTAELSQKSLGVIGREDSRNFGR